MTDHTVDIGRQGRAPTFEYAARFNAAVAFVDRHLTEGRGDAIALRTDAGEVVRYEDLADCVARCGRALVDAGVQPGDRLVMVVLDRPVFFYLFWGAVKAGIVPVPLNTLLRASDYAYAIDDSAAAGVVYSPELAGEVQSALARASHRPGLVLPAEGGADSVLAHIAGARADLPAAASAADDECFWLYSSGSTGRPKGVVHTHADIVATCECYGRGVLAASADDTFLSAAKLFFAYGFGNAMTFPLWVGGCSVIASGRPTPALMAELFERFAPTLFFGVPTLYAAQLQAGTTAPSLRLAVSAGEALPPDLLRRWSAATSVPLLDGIGSTEALHIYISNRPDAIVEGASGTPVPGYDVRILDDAGAAIAGEGSGRLWVRGASIATHYWNQPERNAAAFVDGWFDSGDTYARTPAGAYVYGGRSDDMMKVGGIWCSPFEIESVLGADARVLEAAVVGRANAEGLVKPEAWIVLADPTPDTSALEVALTERCKAHLAAYKYPRWYRFVDQLPKTATGKIKRFVLRRRSSARES